MPEDDLKNPDNAGGGGKNTDGEKEPQDDKTLNQDEPTDDKDGDGKEKDKSKDGDNADKIFTQADLDRVAAKVRGEVEKSFERKAAREKRDADEANLRAKGEFETLYKQSQTRVSELETEVETLRTGVLKERIANEYKLPAKLAAKLSGDTEEELRADAIELAKLVGPPKQPRTEHGQDDQRPNEAKVREAETQRLHSTGRYHRF